MDLGVLFERINPSTIPVGEAAIYADILGPNAVARLCAPGHVINPITGVWFPKERAFGEYVDAKELCDAAAALLDRPSFGYSLRERDRLDRAMKAAQASLYDDLHSTDRCILNVKQGGFARILLTVSGAAPDATEENVTSFLPYTEGPESWKLDANGEATTGIAEFDATKGCVKHPGHIKPLWSAEIGGRIAKRWGKLLHAISAWNEVDGRTYWPGMVETAGESIPFQAAYDDYVYRFLAPFMTAVQMQGVPVWGPATMGFDGLQRLAQHRFDAFDWHNYAEAEKDGGRETLKGFKATLDERIAAIEPYRHGRDIHITEVGDNEGRNGEWLIDAAEYAAEKGVSTFIMGAKQRWIDEERDSLGRVIGRSINKLGLEWKRYSRELARRRTVDHA